MINISLSNTLKSIILQRKMHIFKITYESRHEEHLVITAQSQTTALYIIVSFSYIL